MFVVGFLSFRLTLFDFGFVVIFACYGILVFTGLVFVLIVVLSFG